MVEKLRPCDPFSFQEDSVFPFQRESPQSRMEAAIDKRSPSSCCSEAIAASHAASGTDPTVAGRLMMNFLLV
jgi:hypothetical protein